MEWPAYERDSENKRKTPSPGRKRRNGHALQPLSVLSLKFNKFLAKRRLEELLVYEAHLSLLTCGSSSITNTFLITTQQRTLLHTHLTGSPPAFTSYYYLPEESILPEVKPIHRV